MLLNISMLLACVWAISSCDSQEIPVYDVKNSIVYFESKSTDLSLRGVTDPTKDFKVSLSMFGPVCDYDRDITIEVVDSSFNNAVEGVDFEILSAKVPAGSMKGEMMVRLMNSDNLEGKSVSLSIRENEHFQYLAKGASNTRMNWSKVYLRPTTHVWYSWFLFISQGYSQKYHELLMSALGDEIEISSHRSAALKDPDLMYHELSWWYTASREFYDFVKAHDLAHPDDPYMHSSDYEQYSVYTEPVGSGAKPENIPTILSTLIVW
ncbi:MAG: DUF4843 domain-containing protein [Bacteroidales bacterium]|nr:DUF4843 domain-containing protein [Bacteroidales bacterium]